MKKETCVAIYDHVGKSLNYYTLKRFYSPDEEGCYSDENIRAVAKEMGETEKETRRQMTISENEKKLIQKEVKEIETLFDKLTKKLLYVGLDMEPLRIKGDI